MKTSLYLDKELTTDLSGVLKLIKEAPATVLRMAVREGLKVLRERYAPKPEESKKPAADTAPVKGA